MSNKKHLNGHKSRCPHCGRPPPADGFGATVDQCREPGSKGCLTYQALHMRVAFSRLAHAHQELQGVVVQLLQELHNKGILGQPPEASAEDGAQEVDEALLADLRQQQEVVP